MSAKLVNKLAKKLATIHELSRIPLNPWDYIQEAQAQDEFDNVAFDQDKHLEEFALDLEETLDRIKAELLKQ